MKHDIDPSMDWCRRCGRPRYEILNEDLRECDGLEGVVHSRYISSLRTMEALYGPIIDGIRAELEDTDNGT